MIVQDNDGEIYLRTLGERVRELRAPRKATRDRREAMNDLERILAGQDALYRRADEVSTAGRSIEESLAVLRAAVPSGAR